MIHSFLILLAFAGDSTMPMQTASQIIPTPASQAEPTPAMSPFPSSTKSGKSQFNTQIFEKEPPSGFDDTVKVVREVQDQMQVFFHNKVGVYTLDMRSPSAGKYSQLLVKAMKAKTPLHIVADEFNHQIHSVAEPGEDKPSNSGE